MFEPSNIVDIATTMPNYMGFIFYPKSPRFIQNLSPKILQNIHKDIKKIGVFVNENAENIGEAIALYDLQGIQLHGQESPEFCALLKNTHHNILIIKAFAMENKADWETIQVYIPCIDYVLFDTKTPKHGGSGQTFDWDLLNTYPFAKPFFLSGGISTHNLPQLLAWHKQNASLPLHAVDVNSQIEDSQKHKIKENVIHLQAILKEYSPTI